MFRQVEQRIFPYVRLGRCDAMVADNGEGWGELAAASGDEFLPGCWVRDEDCWRRMWFNSAVPTKRQRTEVSTGRRCCSRPGFCARSRAPGRRFSAAAIESFPPGPE